MWVILQNNADCDYFKTLTLQEILKIQNLRLEEHYVYFGSHTFVPISWMCKKQTCSFSQLNRIWNYLSGHGTEIGRFACSGIMGSNCFCLLEIFLDISDRTGQPDSEWSQTSQDLITKSMLMRRYWFCSFKCPISSNQEALLYVFEDNEAVIKMIMKGRSPTIRHVSWTHRVALDWFLDRVNLDSKIQIKYIDTKHQLADILTKGNFTRDVWNHLLNLFNISHFRSTACTAAMAKRSQQESGQERVTAKSRPMMNLTAKMPSVEWSSTSSNPGRTWYGYQDPGKSVASRRSIRETW